MRNRPSCVIATCLCVATLRFVVAGLSSIVVHDDCGGAGASIGSGVFWWLGHSREGIDSRMSRCGDTAGYHRSGVAHLVFEADEFVG
jgi:hypothetical protein